MKRLVDLGAIDPSTSNWVVTSSTFIRRLADDYPLTRTERSTTSAPAVPVNTHATSWGTQTGKLVCDDFAGYKVSFELGIPEIGCMANAP